MSDYELVIAFTEIGATSQVSFMNFVSIVFGFIIAGYLIADKLSRKMTILITTLFTIVVLQEAVFAVLFLSDQLSLIPEIQTREGLQFHSGARYGDIAGPVTVVTYIATLILAYTGSIIFFFHQRHEGRKAS